MKKLKESFTSINSEDEIYRDSCSLKESALICRGGDGIESILGGGTRLHTDTINLSQAITLDVVCNQFLNKFKQLALPSLQQRIACHQYV